MNDAHESDQDMERRLDAAEAEYRRTHPAPQDAREAKQKVIDGYKARGMSDATATLAASIVISPGNLAVFDKPKGSAA